MCQSVLMDSHSKDSHTMIHHFCLQPLHTSPICSRLRSRRLRKCRCLSGHSYRLPRPRQTVRLLFPFHTMKRPTHALLRGDNLRIVSTSLSMGGRTMSCRCEVHIEPICETNSYQLTICTQIWDTTNHRLVVSATQVWTPFLNIHHRATHVFDFCRLR